MFWYCRIGVINEGNKEKYLGVWIMPTTIDNDNIGRGFQDLVPAGLEGTDTYIDIVTWNIWYFHDKDEERVNTMVDVLEGLNADILVLQEIAYGSLDIVAKRLTERGAGHYEVHYGTTGGNQRVAIMYDLDWVRLKDDVQELYEKGEIISPISGKDAFPRLPLWSYFTALPITNADQPFDFQLLGLHLKSKRGGGADQRRVAGNTLAYWLQNQATRTDADVIITGDWNNTPSSEDWTDLRNLESNGSILFEKINDDSDFSHLYYKNKKNLGSRIDLTAVSVASERQIATQPDVVLWKSLDDFLDTNPKKKEIIKYFQTLKKGVSDHLPVITRFTFTDDDARMQDFLGS